MAASPLFFSAALVAAPLLRVVLDLELCSAMLLKKSIASEKKATGEILRLQEDKAKLCHEIDLLKEKNAGWKKLHENSSSSMKMLQALIMEQKEEGSACSPPRLGRSWEPSPARERSFEVSAWRGLLRILCQFLTVT